MTEREQIIANYNKVFNKIKPLGVNQSPAPMKIALAADERETPKSGGWVQGYSDSEDTSKEGIDIQAKDVIRLDAPEVLLSPDTPLKTKAQDVAGAINELSAGGSGGGGKEDFDIFNDYLLGSNLTPLPLWLYCDPTIFTYSSDYYMAATDNSQKNTMDYRIFTAFRLNRYYMNQYGGTFPIIKYDLAGTPVVISDYLYNWYINYQNGPTQITYSTFGDSSHNYDVYKETWSSWLVPPLSNQRLNMDGYFKKTAYRYISVEIYNRGQPDEYASMINISRWFAREQIITLELCNGTNSTERMYDPVRCMLLVAKPDLEIDESDWVKYLTRSNLDGSTLTNQQFNWRYIPYSYTALSNFKTYQ